MAISEENKIFCITKERDAALLKNRELQKQINEYRKLLWVIVRHHEGLQFYVSNKDLALVPDEAELLQWNEPLFDSVILKAICGSIDQPDIAKSVNEQPILVVHAQAQKLDHDIPCCITQIDGKLRCSTSGCDTPALCNLCYGCKEHCVRDVIT